MARSTFHASRFFTFLDVNHSRHPYSSLPVLSNVLRKTTKNALYLSVNVFSTKVLTEGTIFRDGTAVVCGHPSHAKV